MLWEELNKEQKEFYKEAYKDYLERCKRLNYDKEFIEHELENYIIFYMKDGKPAWLYYPYD